tara:strand:+ start:63 stop:359 length:297 start_codon:yes stop_codon:yes gene_type:complete
MMKKQSSATNNMSVYWNLLMMMVLLGFMMFYASDSHATNHLSGLKSDIADTFGANSDVPYFLLLAEGVVGAMAYIKTKNLMVLAGVPVLMIFTHFALS